MLCRAHHSWFAFHAERVLSDFRLVRHPARITPNAALIAGASCGRRWAPLFANTTVSSRGHGSGSLRSSLFAQSLHRRHSRLPYVHLVPTRSDEGRVVWPCPSHLPQAHDDGTSRATDLAPRRFQAHQSLLPSP